MFTRYLANSGIDSSFSCGYVVESLMRQSSQK